MAGAANLGAAMALDLAERKAAEIIVLVVGFLVVVTHCVSFVRLRIVRQGRARTEMPRYCWLAGPAPARVTWR